MTIFNVAKVLPLHTGYDERPRELCFYLIAVQCVLGRTWGNRDGIRLAAGVSLAVQLLSIPAGRHHYSRPIITMTNKHDIYPIGLSSRHIVLFGWNASRHYHETDFFSFFLPDSNLLLAHLLPLCLVVVALGMWMGSFRAPRRWIVRSCMTSRMCLIQSCLFSILEAWCITDNWVRYMLDFKVS